MRAVLASLVGTGVALALAGCGERDGGEGPLLRALGDDVDAVIVALPAQVAGTWVERAAALAVPDLPACVRERALAADAIAAVWQQRDGADGDWSLVLSGGAAAAAGCGELARGGGLAWYGADPRAGDRRFFTDRERKRRWRSLGAAPLRVIGDVELQAGIVVHVGGTVDPRDGVEARARLRFDERAAADGFEQLRRRHGRDLDRERLGGAWPAFDATLTRDPADPSGTTLRGALRLPGRAGEEAMLFATAALIAGDLGAPAEPCPWIADAWRSQISCIGSSRFAVSADLRDQILDDPGLLAHGARVVPANISGAPAGFKLYAIRPHSLAASLGLKNGDRVHTIGAHRVTNLDDAAAILAGLDRASHLAVEVERRGANVTLRYEIR